MKDLLEGAVYGLVATVFFAIITGLALTIML
jgi:hypothetical protein